VRTAGAEAEESKKKIGFFEIFSENVDRHFNKTVGATVSKNIRFNIF
jgi:hypothetical protein